VPLTPAAGGVPGLSLTRRVVTVFAPFGIGYALSMLFRNVNAAAFPALTREFQFDAAALGLLTSAYFLAFAAFQLPLGALLDRYGPRRVDAALLLVAAAGAALFAASNNLAMLVIARTLIGLGFCACLMAGLAAVVLWFPPERVATLNGFTIATGALGALLATQPVEFAIRLVGWRMLFWGLAGATLLAALVIFVVVPEKARPAPAQSFGKQVRDVLAILGSKRFWQVALPSMSIQGFLLALLGLWAGPWFRDVAGMTQADTGRHLLFAAAGWAVGALCVGLIADGLARRGIPRLVTFQAGCGGCAAALLVIVFGDPSVGRAAWPVYCALSAFGTISYTLLTAAWPKEMTARVLTSVNLMMMGTAFVSQWAVGMVIARWPMVDGHYPPDAYRVAFGTLAALVIATLLQAVIGLRGLRELPPDGPGRGP
jgi:MFS family permease